MLIDRLQRRQFLGGAVFLCGAAFPRLAAAQATALRSFHVATSGNDANPGTLAQPWRTLGRALSAPLLAGDEIVVGEGTYVEQLWLRKGGNADTPLGYVTLRSAIPGGAKLRPPAGAYSTLNVRTNFVIIDGFDLQGGSGHGIDVEHAHHVKVVNNIVHDSGGSGIQYNWSEWITIEGNICFRNAGTNGYQCSGISVYQCRNISGDASTPGFRTIIRRNISRENVEYIAGDHTDGNGIIIDDFQSTQASGFPNYIFASLVENNLCYLNGGKGIQVVWSDNVTVRNNTCWRNNLDLRNPGTWRGELSNAQSSGGVWVNNIAVADRSVHSSNTAIGFQSYGGLVSRNVAWRHNLTFNGTPGDPSLSLDGGNAAPSAANGNLLGVDPRFVSAGSDFRPGAGSRALGAGTLALGVADVDLVGNPRVTRAAVDLGCYQSTGTIPPVRLEPESLWNAATALRAADGTPWMLGTIFSPTRSGKITHVRFYAVSGERGEHTAYLWDNRTGARLARKTFSAGGIGWRAIALEMPAAVQAGVLYTVGVTTGADAGRSYACIGNALVTAGGNGKSLTYPAHAGTYGASLTARPTKVFRSSNYLRDVVFEPLD